MENIRVSSAAVTPAQWGATQSAPPVLSVGGQGLSGASLRRWTDTNPDVDQPALTQAYIVLHLGGAKRITRTGEGRVTSVDAALGAISVIPAGAAYTWRTEGPIDFAHVYLSTEKLREIAVQTFDRDGRDLEFTQLLGANDELVRALMAELMSAAEAESQPPELYWDAMMSALMLRLIREHSNLGAAASRARHTLSQRRLRRVLDYVEASLSKPVRLSDLASVAGCSASHFSHAFARAKGRSPYSYVLARRVNRAKELLRDTGLPLSLIAPQCGFQSTRQLSRMFKRETGVTPTAFCAVLYGASQPAR